MLAPNLQAESLIKNAIHLGVLSTFLGFLEKMIDGRNTLTRNLWIMQLVNIPDMISILNELPSSFSLSRGSLSQRTQVILMPSLGRISPEFSSNCLHHPPPPKNTKNKNKKVHNSIHIKHSDFKSHWYGEYPCYSGCHFVKMIGGWLYCNFKTNNLPSA